jgi:hypothetical protein
MGALQVLVRALGGPGLMPWQRQVLPWQVRESGTAPFVEAPRGLRLLFSVGLPLCNAQHSVRTSCVERHYLLAHVGGSFHGLR